MRHFLKSFRETTLEGHNFGVLVAIQRSTYLFGERQLVRKNGSVLHKPVLIFDMIECEKNVVSYEVAFLKDFASDFQYRDWSVVTDFSTILFFVYFT